MDMGSDAEEDDFYKRKLIEEVGAKADGEDDWKDRDARQIRQVSRYGYKIVIDDRGSDPKKADSQEEPYANGILIKGRRDNRGFGWEFNEKTEINSTKWYTPKGKVIEMNDKGDYIAICTQPVGGENKISEDWQKLAENEFATNQARTFDPESNTFHFILDGENQYMRLKTPKFAGIESRDDGLIWTEIRDSEDRGIFFSETDGHAVWHAKDGKELAIIMADSNDPAILISEQRRWENSDLLVKRRVEVISRK